jgi:hypothetical protein
MVSLGKVFGPNEIAVYGIFGPQNIYLKAFGSGSPAQKHNLIFSL